MIQALHLLHYLEQGTYERVADVLGYSEKLRTGKSADVYFPSGGIRAIKLFDIEYKVFGHIWFLDAHFDFPSMNCTYEGFDSARKDAFAQVIGQRLAGEMPGYDALCCGYIEYGEALPVVDAEKTMSRLRLSKMAPEQLDKSKWETFEKPHATITFCVDKLDSTHLETLARCHGTALKRRIKDSACHKTVGLLPRIAINQSTERDILDDLYRLHHVVNP